MPLQNRVTPEGDIVAAAERGTMMGNRGGCFHRDDRTLARTHWASRQWICCVLQFKGRRRTVMSPGLYTELFFLDEATALAAGHRPCFECRREQTMHFSALFGADAGLETRSPAPAMDLVLHRERLGGRAEPATARLADLPDGAFVRGPRGPLLLHSGRLLPWSLAGYGPPEEVSPAMRLPVLTPPSIVAVLARGYRPLVHATAVGSL